MSARALLQILSLLVLSSAPSASVSLGIVADKHFPLPLPSLPSLKSVPRLAHVHAPDCPSDGDAGSWQGQASRAGDETGRAGEGKAWEAVQRRRWGKKLESLVQGGAIRSREVLGAMTGAPRFHFCCHGGWCDPALDYPQPIGAGATISEPFVHAVCLEALAGPLLLARAAGGARALDLASGSGYITAGLALLAGPRGKVEGVEHVAGLAALSEANLRAADLQGAGRVEIRVADALDAAALPRGDGFDAIHVGAALSESDAAALLPLLRAGGRMVAPIASNRRLGGALAPAQVRLVAFDCVSPGRGNGDVGKVERRGLGVSLRMVPLGPLPEQRRFQEAVGGGLLSFIAELRHSLTPSFLLQARQRRKLRTFRKLFPADSLLPNAPPPLAV